MGQEASRRPVPERAAATFESGVSDRTGARATKYRTPQALPADEDDGRETSRRHEMFLEAELQGADGLANNNQTEAQDVGAQGRVPLFAEAARDAHQRHGGADDGDGDVVVRPELLLEPAHAEDTGKDHDAAARHLVG